MRVLAICAVLFQLGDASAEPTRDVVLAGADVVLIAAVEAALAPAKVIVVRDPPPTTIGTLSASSRQLVERENTEAALWLISDGTSTTLVAYDRVVDRVLVRAVPYPTPLSDADAAVTARSARAMLRSLRVDAEPRQPPPPNPPAVVEAGVLATSREVAARMSTSAGIGLRLGSPGRDANAELSIGATWRPDALGLAVELALSPASSARGAMFEGTIGDRSLALVTRLPVRVDERLRVSGDAGIALHAIRFAGDAPMGRIVDWQLDPALRIGVGVSYAVVDGIDVGLAVSTDLLLRRQRYEVEGEEIVVMQQLQLATGVSITIRVL